jgi:hypothetical protein
MKKSLIKVTILLAAILFVTSCKKDKEPVKSSLDKWVGTYTVTAESYYGDAQVPPIDTDESWTVTVSVVDTNDTMLEYSGIGINSKTISSTPVFATLDPDALTIEFKSGQSIGNIHDYGDTKIYFATADIISYIDDPVTEEILTAAEALPISGTIDETGNMVIDKLGVVREGPMVYDVFKTTWVKQ